MDGGCRICKFFPPSFSEGRSLFPLVELVRRLFFFCLFSVCLLVLDVSSFVKERADSFSFPPRGFVFFEYAGTRSNLFCACRRRAGRFTQRNTFRFLFRFGVFGDVHQVGYVPLRRGGECAVSFPSPSCSAALPVDCERSSPFFFSL